MVNVEDTAANAYTRLVSRLASRWEGWNVPAPGRYWAQLVKYPTMRPGRPGAGVVDGVVADWVVDGVVDGEEEREVEVDTDALADRVPGDGEAVGDAVGDGGAGDAEAQFGTVPAGHKVVPV